MTFSLDGNTTALVLIDLQHGILAMPMQPHPAEQVLTNSQALLEAFRKRNAPVVFVRVDLAAMKRPTTDGPQGDPTAPPPPPQASQLVPEAGALASDLVITKHHWGAFAHTELERELQSRGVATVVLGGVMTSLAIDSTAREAASLGLNVVVAEDACSSIDLEGHTATIKRTVPLLGRVRSTSEIVDALA